MYSYTIMNLDTEHINEICDDIKYQYEHGIANMPLFKMTLVPEGSPPKDKVGPLCKKYGMFRDILSNCGIPSGVLVQASIGHDWVLSDMFPYQQYINFTDGKPEFVVCPYDDGFKEYIYNVMKTIAEHKPDHIMVDDDFRLIFREGSGCACPLHIERFKQLSCKDDITREKLLDIIVSKKDNYKELSRIFISTQTEALVETAKIMRKAIDSVNPKLQGSFCCVSNSAENATEISEVLAGKGNPKIVRINNAKYTATGPKFLTDSFFKAKSQIEKLQNKVDIILAETDTCPQNRYSTSAMMVHAQYTGSILEGVCGAKHWITRLGAYEPQSGTAYRKILAKYSNFYEALSKTVPTLKWRGCRIPVSKEAKYELNQFGWNGGIDKINGWGSCVLERFGLPMYFSAENGGILCLEGEADKVLSDDSVLKALKGNVFLASDTAQRLIKRGFGEYLGVDVKNWCGKQPTYEKIYATGQNCAYQMQIKELIKTSPDTKSYSDVYHTVDYENSEYLFPGTIAYTNTLGGTVYTFSGTPKTQYNIIEAFSFLCYSRKQQIIEMMKETGELLAYYPNDEEVYLKVADTADGKLFCALFNLGFDPIEKTEIVIERCVSKIEMLVADGTKKEVFYTESNGKYTLDVQCNTLQPLILFIS